MDKDDLKYICLFGGGAIRGISYVGVIQALKELGIKIDTFGGSSVGAIIAALLAVGYTAEEMNDIFLKVNFDLFKDVQFTFGPKLALSKGELFLDWIRDLIESKFYGDKYKKGSNRAVTFDDIEKNLVIITTDLSNYDCKEFSRYETPDYEIAMAVRISCTMPGLMKPIKYNNTLLVDGDLQKSWPMWKLSTNLMTRNERLLEFRLEGFAEQSDTNVLNYVNTVYSCMTAMATSFITELYGAKDKFDYVVINTGNVLIVDFNLSLDKRKQLMKMGYEQTMAYFKSFLPQKKKRIFSHYSLINDSLKKIKLLIISDKYKEAKNKIGELFIELCELNKIIDSADYKELKKFKDIYNENLRYPALFGKVSLKNKTEVKENLNKLLKQISSKTEELENYIKKYSP